MLTAKQAHTVRALSSLHAILINNLNTLRQTQSSAYFTRLHFLGQPLRPNTATPSAPSITSPLLRHRQTIHEGCTRTLSGSSDVCAPLVVVAIVLQIFASQIHRRGEVGRGRGGGKVSHQAPKPDGMERTAAQWGLTPQVGNATLGVQNVRSGSRN